MSDNRVHPTSGDVVDVTDLRLRDRAFDEPITGEMFGGLVDELHQPIVVLDGAGRVTYANRAAHGSLVVASVGTPRFRLPLERGATIVAVPTADGATTSARVSIFGAEAGHRIAVFDLDGTADDPATTTDTLTGLPDRRALIAAIESALSTPAVRVDPARRLMLVQIDLDRFNTINVGLGNRVGDVILAEFAERLTAGFGDSLVARAGSDSFVLLCSELRLDDVLERIERITSRQFDVDGHRIIVTASIGVTYRTAGTDVGAGTLMGQASSAVMQAKTLGRNRHAIFSGDLYSAAQKRLEAEQRLQQALRENELVVHYQPQIDLASGEVVGAEALLRWRSSEGLRSPVDFIGVAEESGLIVPIGMWVFEQACRQLASWNEQFGRQLRMSINLSARQVSQPSLVDDLWAVVLGTGVDPRLIDLEITESVLMRDVERSVTALRTLRGFGVQVAIDDFGTGYSSLQYLRHLPLDILKIDRGFVAELGSDETADAIVRTIVDLAHTLGLIVTAEGVESEDQLERLRALGCDQIQGHLIARSQSAVDFARLLDASPAVECG